MIGDSISGGTALSTNVINLTVPAQPAGAVLIFNLAYVNVDFAGGAGGVTPETNMGRYVYSAPTGTAPPSVAFRRDFYKILTDTDGGGASPLDAPGNTVRQEIIWAKNPQAGTYSFTFPDVTLGTTRSMAVVQVFRLLGADPDAPFKQITSSSTNIHDVPATPTPVLPYASEDSSLSVLSPSCPTIFFGAGRHVTGQTSNPGTGMFTLPGSVTSVNEYVPIDVFNRCQIGLEGGTFTGTGFSFNSWTNNVTVPSRGVQDHAVMVGIEINCIDSPAASVIRSSVCTLDATNACCNGVAEAELHVSGRGSGIFISAGVGNHFQVIYEVNGTEYVAAEVDNSAGCGPLALTFPPFNFSDAVGLVNPCDAAITQTVRTKTRCITYSTDPANAITIGPWRARLRLDHV